MNEIPEADEFHAAVEEPFRLPVTVTSVTGQAVASGTSPVGYPALAAAY